MYAIQKNTPSFVDRTVLWAHRDIPLSHGKHVCGRVAWMPPPQSVPVESDLEALALDFLIRQPGLVAVHSQPFTINYWVDDQRRRYTPDFLVVYDDLSRELRRLGFERWTVLEIKPASRQLRLGPAVAARLQAVRHALGLATVCLTDRDICGRALS